MHITKPTYFISVICHLFCILKSMNQLIFVISLLSMKRANHISFFTNTICKPKWIHEMCLDVWHQTNGTYWKISTSLECFIESITYIQAKLFVRMLCHRPLVYLPCCHCLHINLDTFYENKNIIVA